MSEHEKDEGQTTPNEVEQETSLEENVINESTENSTSGQENEQIKAGNQEVQAKDVMNYSQVSRHNY